MSPTSDWSQQERASVEKWTKNDQDKDENIRAITAIEALANDEQSASDTARQIADIYEPRLASKQRLSIGVLWGIISGATTWFGGSASQRLADLMIAIRELPDVVDSMGHIVKDGGQVIWKGLPSWGWIFREHGVGINLPNLDYPNILDENSYSEWHNQAPGLLNATTFAANLMKNGNVLWQTNMAFHAHVALKEGLEDPYDSTREMPHEWKMYIPPAVAWIMIGGRQIHQLCFDSSVDTHATANSSRKSFNPETWVEWKRRCRTLAQQPEIDTYYQNLAAQAADEMDRIQQSNDEQVMD